MVAFSGVAPRMTLAAHTSIDVRRDRADHKPDSKRRVVMRRPQCEADGTEKPLWEELQG